MSRGAVLTVKNKAATVSQLGVAIARLRDTEIKLYREIVWKVFTHIVRNTPAYSGAAVAHWTIGIGKSEAFYDPGLGRPDSSRKAIREGTLQPFQKGGDHYWARLARDRERPKLQRIRRGTVVVIANGVIGDTDNGKASAAYLESLQNPAYAADKLRAANQPYTTVEESALIVATQYWNKKIDPFTWMPAGEFEP